MFLDEALVLPVSARTATTTSGYITNYCGASGAIVFVNVTAISDTPSITNLKIVVEDGFGNSVDVYTLTPTSAITSTGRSALAIYPVGSLATGGFAGTPVIGVLPNKFKITVTHGDADSITYGVYIKFIN